MIQYKHPADIIPFLPRDIYTKYFIRLIEQIMKNVPQKATYKSFKDIYYSPEAYRDVQDWTNYDK